MVKHLTSLNHDRLIAIIEHLAKELARWMESELAATGMGIHEISPNDLIRASYRRNRSRNQIKHHRKDTVK